MGTLRKVTTSIRNGMDHSESGKENGMEWLERWPGQIPQDLPG